MAGAIAHAAVQKASHGGAGDAARMPFCPLEVGRSAAFSIVWAAGTLSGLREIEIFACAASCDSVVQAAYDLDASALAPLASYVSFIVELFGRWLPPKCHAAKPLSRAAV